MAAHCTVLSSLFHLVLLVSSLFKKDYTLREGGRDYGSVDGQILITTKEVETREVAFIQFHMVRFHLPVS